MGMVNNQRMGEGKTVIKNSGQGVGMRKQQRGYTVWIVLLVLFVLVVAAWQYNRVQTRSRLLAQQATEARAAQQRQEAERLALERRIAEQKQQADVLAASQRAIDEVLMRWDDAKKVAHTSGRIALPAPVGVLQAIRRDAEQLTVAPCMDPAKKQLVASMEHTIKGFLVFMQNDLKLGEVLAQADFEDAAKQMVAFAESRRACQN